MAVASPVDICNLALKRLGVAAIVALDEGTDRASACATLYPATRDRLLREFEWNFAQVRVNLTKLSTVPAFGYGAEYALPTLPLALKINETDPPDAEYDIEVAVNPVDGTVTSPVIRTDETSLGVRYTAQITDVSRWSASFVDVVAWELAAQLAYPLTESPGKAKELSSIAANALQHARSVDSQEGSTKTADVNTLVNVRFHGVIDDFSRNRNSI